MDFEKALAIACAPIAAMLYVKARDRWWKYQDDREAAKEAWTSASLVIPLVTHDTEASAGDVGRDGLPLDAGIHEPSGEIFAVSDAASRTPRS